MAKTTPPGLDQVSLLDALLSRRSRRFGRGMRLDGGPLAHASAQAPEPLSPDEEAALAFAACGITGCALAELPFHAGGNIRAQFVGRAAAGGGDAIHPCVVFVLNDQGAWMLRRPQDFTRAELPGLVEAARQRRFTELYERSRVRVADRRPDPPRAYPFVAPFNCYSANVPGSTWFLPVLDVTPLYVNMLLALSGHELAAFVLDDRDGYRPAGLARFARSAGGHLGDDPVRGRVLTVGALEAALLQFCAVEHTGSPQASHCSSAMCLALLGPLCLLGGAIIPRSAKRG
jgi:hypothetical protein